MVKMGYMATSTVRCLAVCLLIVAATQAAPAQYTNDYWLQGRASWYGNQGSWVDPFAPYRGGGRSAFGVLPWGGCGLTNGDGTVLWPRDQVTAYATGNTDFPGACGRCYEVRCAPGPVVGWNNQTVDFRSAYFPFWWYANTTDKMGRSFPGNSGESKRELDVKCWDPKQSVVVKVIDICPCYYEPANQAPYYQYGCCYKEQNHPKAGQLELDLSFWAFEKLAHPEYGIMMVKYRPVDCNNHKPMQFDPGYISDKIYDDFPGVGWAWFAYGYADTNQFAVVDKGKGLRGSAASCATLKPSGGMSWACRRCGDKAGYQPFAGASSVSFWIMSAGSPGSVPPLTLQLTNPDNKKNCNAVLDLTSRSPETSTTDGWLKYTINMADFDCPSPEQMNQLLWSVKGGVSGNTQVCLDEVGINRGGAAVPAAATASPAPASG